jgi:magnesium transporter
MFKKRFPAPGTPPAHLVPLMPGPGTPPTLRVIEYDRTSLREWTAANVAELPDCPEDGKTRWIEFNGLGDVEALKALGQKYGLHPLALEDVLHTGQRPKVDAYEGHLFIVAQMVYHDAAGRLCGEQVSMFVCPHFLITVQEEPNIDVFEPVRARLRAANGHIRRQRGDYLAYALLDAIIDNCFPVLETMDNTIDQMETKLLKNPDRECAHSLHQLKRLLAQMRRLVWPERDVVTALLHDHSGIISDNTKIFLRDCYDHTVQIMDLIESYRDVVSGLMEMYLSAVGMRTNEIMRVLTVISSIFIPLTFIAGVYGMNFAPEPPAEMPLRWNMPELYHPYGYLGILLVMAIIAGAQIYFFRRNKWL